MKPTKSKKKAISENQSGSTIENYFKSTPKESVECAPSSNGKSFYINVLKAKLKSYDDESASNNDSNSGRDNSATVVTDSTTEPATDELTKNKSNGCDQCQESGRVDKTNGCSECEKWRKKYKELEKSYLKLSVRHVELTMKHEDLVLTSTGTLRPNTEENSDGVSKTLSVSDGIFTENEIKCLQCLPLDKKKDSTFILNCIQYAYKNNTDSLSKKTLKGTRARFEVIDGDIVTVKGGKDPLTPEKVQRIQELFIDRVKKANVWQANSEKE